MSRINRIVLEGVPYHITQRGNARQRVFFDQQDYDLYLDLLKASSADARLRMLAYCLMPNHVHLIVVPERPEAMPGALGRTHAAFARYFNLRHRACGHVWQSRYFSCPMDELHLWQAMAYVERNPVRAGLVERAGEFAWSSARLRLGLNADQSFVDLAEWRQQYSAERWRQVLETSVQEEAFGQRLQEAGRRGRPLGCGEFTDELELRAGRKLRPLPAGRPRKQAGEQDNQLTLEIGV